MQPKPQCEATVENPRGSVEKLFPKESVKGANTVVRGSVRAHEGLAEENSEEALTLPCSTMSASEAPDFDF